MGNFLREVREKKLGVALEAGVVDLPDLEKTVPVYFPAGLLQGIAWNVIFLPERQHENGKWSGYWVKCPEKTHNGKIRGRRIANPLTYYVNLNTRAITNFYEPW